MLGLATWVVEWPICSPWQSPLETETATSKLNAPLSLHDR